MTYTNDIALGDFRQCLPVVPRASRAQIVAATITYSLFWRHVTVLHLSINMRLLADAEEMTPNDRLQAEEFAAWLLQVDEGRLNDLDDSMTVKLPSDIIQYHISDSLNRSPTISISNAIA